MKLTNQVIFNLNEILNDLNIPANVHFNYMVKRNKDKFKSILEKSPKYIQPQDKEYTKYLEDVKKKIETEKINFKTMDELNKYYEDNIKKYPKAEKIRKDSIESFKKKVEKWEQEVNDITLYKTSVENFPNNLKQQEFEYLEEWFAIKENQELKK